MASNSSAGCSSVPSASGDSLHLNQAFIEWNENVIVLEMKVNEEAAHISIFCPLLDSVENKCVEVVKFTENSIEFIRDLTPENSSQPTLKRYAVTFANQLFDPESVSAEIWSESRRLFTCHVNLQYRDYICGLRRFYEIQAYMSNKVTLQHYCERLSKDGVKVSCRVCLTTFLTTGDNSPMKFIVGSDDPILNELGNCELNDFVVQSCANHHGCHEKSDGILKAVNNKGSNQPTADSTILSEIYLTLRKTDEMTGFAIDNERRIVKCKGCINELGYVSKGHPNVLQLHLTALNIDDLSINRNFMIERFESLERYFAFLLLRHSGIDSSLKLLFRTCEKEPYVLIWLIEPIVVFGSGKLKEVVEDEVKQPPQVKKKGRRVSTSDSSIINTACTLKVLYKVFDSSPGSDQKYNTVDPSVSFVDIPLASCMSLEEILLRNSTKLPNTSRSLGNFLISFLNVDDE